MSFDLNIETLYTLIQIVNTIIQISSNVSTMYLAFKYRYMIETKVFINSITDQERIYICSLEQHFIFSLDQRKRNTDVIIFQQYQNIRFIGNVTSQQNIGEQKEKQQQQSYHRIIAWHILYNIFPLCTAAFYFILNGKSTEEYLLVQQI
ncbi:unnamed protein product [Paramecium octaurelia]|uniref:Transmembrane protein n=1 Tax=Paramecium octaurelia TaxID=43137 RepID=A0A8S1YE51_PAROT|nr:unnamed protein product [Paramecium octaurelia]